MDSDAPSSGSDRKRRSAWLWLIGVLVGLLALYALAGFLWLPALARREIRAYVQRAPGVQLTLGAVSVNPFTLNAQALDLMLSGPDGAPLLGFQRLQIVASASSLWQRAWVFRRIELDQPLVNLRIARDGSVNLQRLLAARSPVSVVPPGAAAGSAPWPRVRIGSLVLHAGTVRFQDLSRATPFATALSPIEIALSDFRTQPSFDSRYRFSSGTADLGQLDWAGTLSVQPLASAGQFAASGVAVSPLAAYLGKLPVTLRGGSLNLQGDYHFRAAAPGTLAVTLQTLSIRGLQAAPAGAVPPAGAPQGGAPQGTAPQGAAPPWVSLPQIDLSGASVDVAARRVDIQQITLQQPSLEVDRAADGSLDLLREWSGATGNGAGAASPVPSQLPGQVSSPAPGAARAAPPAPAASWALALARLSIENATLELIDQSVQPAVRLHVSPLTLSVRNYSSTGGAPVSIDLTTGLGRAGQLHASGSLSFAPLLGSLQLDLQHFDLTSLQPYVARQTAMTLYRGELAVQATAEIGGPAGLLANGSLTASNFATRDNVTGVDFITGRSVQLSGLRYRQSPPNLRIASVLARGLYGRVIIGPNGTFNLAEILRPARSGVARTGPAAPAVPAVRAAPAVRAVSAGGTPKAGETAGSTGALASLPLSIGRVDLRGGTADFADHSVQPNFSAGIVGLHGSIVGLSSDPASRAQLHLQGSVNQYAPVTIDGQVNVLSAATYTDLSMTFSNIDLTIFNPYSGKFAGYNIAQGKLTTQMHYHVESRRLQATHHIVIDQLEFGPATDSKQAVPLPIKLAAALLKDRNGVISLDLPVSGTLDDPSFRLGPIIWKVFTGLIRKIVTAPFAWLGSLFGGGAGQQLAYVDFTAGSATLAPAQSQKLSQLAKALVQRPQLRLDIPLHTLSVADDQQLEHSALEQAVQQMQAQPPSTAGTAGRRRGTRGTGSSGGHGGRQATNDAASSAAPPRLAALTELYQQKFQAVPRYPADVADEQARDMWLEQQLLPRFAPTRQQRDALARERADAAEATVLAGQDLSPARVFLTNTVSGGGPAGAVRMQLQLE